MEMWVFRLTGVHCGNIGRGRVELGFILSLSAVFCSRLVLYVKDTVITVSDVLNQICCCILHGPGGECIIDVVPGVTELEPQVKKGSWAGRTHSQ